MIHCYDVIISVNFKTIEKSSGMKSRPVKTLTSTSEVQNGLMPNAMAVTQFLTQTWGHFEVK